MNPFHWAFDKLYPAIRFYHETVKDNAWFTQITPTLWLGGAPTMPKDYDVLVANGIKAVVDIRTERRDDEAFYAAQGIDYLHINVLDMGVPNSADLTRSVAFIRKYVEQEQPVLIHCAKGRGRSAVTLAAYLMKYHNMSFPEAVAFMKAKRRLVKQEPRHQKSAENWFATQSVDTVSP
ncbi:MAG: dual specificity protein phosphatase family protein [Candidatus Promineifilaceae bacterium]